MSAVRPKLQPYTAVALCALLIACSTSAMDDDDDSLNIKIVWWDNPPYLYEVATAGQLSDDHTWDAHLEGVYKTVLQDLLHRCNISEGSSNDTTASISALQVNNSLDLPLVQSDYRDDNTVMIFVGVSTRPREPASLLRGAGCTGAFLRVLETPGAVHFYKKEAEPVGSDLLTVIIQGWPLLILILLGAGYSGIIIWLLVSQCPRDTLSQHTGHKRHTSIIQVLRDYST